MPNAWVYRPRPSLRGQVRVVCIPHAGGNAQVFRAWGDFLDDRIDVTAVQFPGRMQRVGEPMPGRMGVLVRALEQGLADLNELPFALFGSCTGSLIAFELAVRLRARGRRGPVHLFTSSCRAPHMPDRDPPLHALPDDALLQALHALGGTPQLLLQHPELLRVLGPALRRDFEVAETYTYRAVDPLDCPITTFGGDRDPVVDPEERAAWQAHTTAAFSSADLDGGHYLVEDAGGQLCAAIQSRLLD